MFQTPAANASPSAYVVVAGTQFPALSLLNAIVENTPRGYYVNVLWKFPPEGRR